MMSLFRSFVLYL